jgi:hypothetical protein
VPGIVRSQWGGEDDAPSRSGGTAQADVRGSARVAGIQLPGGSLAPSYATTYGEAMAAGD